MTRDHAATVTKWIGVAGVLLTTLTAGITMFDWWWVKLQAILMVPYVQNSVASALAGTGFCLVVPWALAGHMESRRAMVSLRIGSILVAFTVGAALDNSLPGVIFAANSAAWGPMLGLNLWRLLLRCPWFPHPPALKPTISEAHEQLTAAVAAAKKTEPLPVINPSEPQ